MIQRLTPFAGAVRALFAPYRRDTLTPPRPVAAGGRGMARRVVPVVLAAVALAAAGYGAYAFLRHTPTPHEVAPPVFTASDDPPPPAATFAELAESDPVGMYEACLSRYAREAKGFRATVEKHERTRGELRPREVVRIEVRDQPPAALLRWQEGGQRGVTASLYAPEVTGPQIKAWRPAAALATLRDWSIDAKGDSARQASRYCVKDAGLYPSMLRTYTAWKKRKEAGDLRTEYLGKQVVGPAGGRECHVVRRYCPRTEIDPFALDEEAPTDPKVIARDGFTEVTVMIDAERWLQVGSVLKNASGALVGEYYFRDVELVTEFPPDTFTLANLRKK